MNDQRLGHAEVLKRAKGEKRRWIQFASDLGVSRHTLQNWRKRDFIPEERRADVIQLAEGRITADDFSLPY